MKILVFLSTLAFSVNLSAQTEEDCRLFLSEVNNPSDLDSLIPIFPDWDVSTISVASFEQSKDTAVFSSSIFLSFKNNGTKDYLLKSLREEKKEFCKVNYVLINGTKLSSIEISELQDQIIDEYNAGKTVDELIEKYNRLGHTSNVLDWFNKETMSADFENAVWNLKENEVLKLSIPNKNWHYVVFKTEENKIADVAYCVRIEVCQVGCPNPEMEMPEFLAEFPGGAEAMSKFIRNEVKYPDAARINNIEGQVVVLFIVETDGTRSNILIHKGVSTELNNEAKRLVEIMPRWTPAMHNDVKVRSQCSLPITFLLEK